MQMLFPDAKFGGREVCRTYQVVARVHGLAPLFGQISPAVVRDVLLLPAPFKVDEF
jgi:hypothetical protein